VKASIRSTALSFFIASIRAVGLSRSIDIKCYQ
jgi:hypothetical protein